MLRSYYACNMYDSGLTMCVYFSPFVCRRICGRVLNKIRPCIHICRRPCRRRRRRRSLKFSCSCVRVPATGIGFASRARPIMRCRRASWPPLRVSLRVDLRRTHKLARARNACACKRMRSYGTNGIFMLMLLCYRICSFGWRGVFARQAFTYARIAAVMRPIMFSHLAWPSRRRRRRRCSADPLKVRLRVQPTCASHYPHHRTSDIFCGGCCCFVQYVNMSLCIQ